MAHGVHIYKRKATLKIHTKYAMLELLLHKALAQACYLRLDTIPLFKLNCWFEPTVNQ